MPVGAAARPSDAANPSRNHKLSPLWAALQGMSVPGAGLLALLRKRSEPEAPQLGVVSQAPPASGGGGSGSSKFEARSSAVHALEHAVAAGGQAADAVKSAAQGRRIPAGPTYTYDVDVQGAHEAQPQLSVRAGLAGSLLVGAGCWYWLLRPAVAAV